MIGVSLGRNAGTGGHRGVVTTPDTSVGRRVGRPAGVALDAGGRSLRRSVAIPGVGVVTDLVLTAGPKTSHTSVYAHIMVTIGTLILW